MSASEKKNRNWLLIFSRKWHTWLGVAVSLVAVAICATGFYLNHEELFHGRKEPKERGPSGELRTTTALAQVPIGFDTALAEARRHWGDRPIENIQLKDEHGKLVYKIKAEEGQDLTVDARTGAAILKEGYGLREHAPGGASVAAGYNWGKILKDVHTGKIFGDPGRLLVDFTSFVLIVLTISGVYLWVVPKLRKRAAQVRVDAAIGAHPPTRPAVNVASSTARSFTG